jgi:hypothetical protein
MALPWTHLSPASITLHLELSIMIGMRAISGSVGDQVQERAHRGSESSMPSSMLTSRMLAPPRTCSSGDLEAAS